MNFRKSATSGPYDMPSNNELQFTSNTKPQQQRKARELLSLSKNSKQKECTSSETLHKPSEECHFSSRGENSLRAHFKRPLATPKKQMSIEQSHGMFHVKALKRKNQLNPLEAQKKIRLVVEPGVDPFEDTFPFPEDTTVIPTVKITPTASESAVHTKNRIDLEAGGSSAFSGTVSAKPVLFNDMFKLASQQCIKAEFEDDFFLGLTQTSQKFKDENEAIHTDDLFSTFFSQNDETSAELHESKKLNTDHGGGCAEMNLTQFSDNTQFLKQVDAAIKQEVKSERASEDSKSCNDQSNIAELKDCSQQIRTNPAPDPIFSHKDKTPNLLAAKPRDIRCTEKNSTQPVTALDEAVATFFHEMPKIGKKVTSTPTKDQMQLPIEFWDDSIANGLTQFFNSSQYKCEVETTFNRIENTIYDFGTNQDVSIAKQLSPAHGIIEGLLERTFRSPEMIKRVLQSAEESIRVSSSNTPWSDDSLLANAVINLSVEGQSIGSLIRKALMDNADKSLPPQRMVNVTIKEEDVAFRSYGKFYGLPDKVKDLIKMYKGIDQLYEWQDECLNLPAINSRKNLVYALPTSGGKTLVAEILILREILCRKKNAIFILPYVAIVQEKVWALSPFAVAMEFLIEEYAAGKGNYPPRKRRRKRSVYIATIEKALGLMNSLIETGRTEEVGLIVVDELHLIGDRSRGPALEGLLTKIIHLKEKIQIVGMSATIGNLPDICEFLQADVYTKNFRPVELVEYVKCGQEIAKVDWNASSEEDILVFERKVDYQYAESLNKIDPDQLGGLVMEVIPNGSCLIFCKSKKNCENVAMLLCKVIFEELKNYKVMEKDAIKTALRDEAGSLCDILKVSITYGVAYHHSGLTSEERRIIEEGFRQGAISVICCTSTLAAGVNLPAKRVIVRNPYIGRDFINLSRYKQMVGRAGRAGLGELGESILISTPQELPRVRDLFKSPMDMALSGMFENECYGLRQFLLSCVSLGIANNKIDLQTVCSGTLMAVQSQKLKVDIKNATRSVIKALFKMGAIQIEGAQDKENSNQADVTVQSSQSLSNASPVTPKQVVVVKNDSKLEISQLGKAAIKGGLDLGKALVLYGDLIQAQCSLVLFTGLHLMYLVTPYDISEQVNPSYNLYYTLYSQLGLRELQTANVLGLNDAVASKMLSNRKITEVPLRVLNRFYVTLMLYDLWNEMPLCDVARKYEVNRGLIQNLMTAAATFASNVYHFCDVLEEFWAFSLLLKGMSDRLSHCCVKELSPLMKLPAVKQNRARQLFQAGFKTLQSIAKANPDDLMESVEYMTRKLANQLVAAAKLILLERVENLREEAEDVIDGIDF